MPVPPPSFFVDPFAAIAAESVRMAAGGLTAVPTPPTLVQALAWPTRVHIDLDAPANGNGTAASPFNRLDAAGPIGNQTLVLIAGEHHAGLSGDGLSYAAGAVTYVGHWRSVDGTKAPWRAGFYAQVAGAGSGVAWSATPIAGTSVYTADVTALFAELAALHPASTATAPGTAGTAGEGTEWDVQQLNLGAVPKYGVLGPPAVVKPSKTQQPSGAAPWLLVPLGRHPRTGNPINPSAGTIAAHVATIEAASSSVSTGRWFVSWDLTTTPGTRLATLYMRLPDGTRPGDTHEVHLAVNWTASNLAHIGLPFDGNTAPAAQTIQPPHIMHVPRGVVGDPNTRRGARVVEVGAGAASSTLITEVVTYANGGSEETFAVINGTGFLAAINDVAAHGCGDEGGIMVTAASGGGQSVGDTVYLNGRLWGMTGVTDIDGHAVTDNTLWHSGVVIAPHAGTNFALVANFLGDPRVLNRLAMDVSRAAPAITVEDPDAFAGRFLFSRVDRIGSNPGVLFRNTAAHGSVINPGSGNSAIAIGTGVMFSLCAFNVAITGTGAVFRMSEDNSRLWLINSAFQVPNANTTTLIGVNGAIDVTVKVIDTTVSKTGGTNATNRSLILIGGVQSNGVTSALPSGTTIEAGATVTVIGGGGTANRMDLFVGLGSGGSLLGTTIPGGGTLAGVVTGSSFAFGTGDNLRPADGSAYFIQANASSASTIDVGLGETLADFREFDDALYGPWGDGDVVALGQSAGSESFDAGFAAGIAAGMVLGSA